MNRSKTLLKMIIHGLSENIYLKKVGLSTRNCKLPCGIRAMSLLDSPIAARSGRERSPIPLRNIVCREVKNRHFFSPLRTVVKLVEPIRSNKIIILTLNTNF